MGECERPWAGQLREEGCEYASVSARSHTCLWAHLCVVCLCRVRCSHVCSYMRAHAHMLHMCVHTYVCGHTACVHMLVSTSYEYTLGVLCAHVCDASTYMDACRNVLGGTAGGSSWLLCVLLRFDSLPPPSLHLPQPPPRPASFRPQKAQLPGLQTVAWAAVSGG